MEKKIETRICNCRIDVGICMGLQDKKKGFENHSLVRIWEKQIQVQLIQ
jgi:hypothetical protein